MYFYANTDKKLYAYFMLCIVEEVPSEPKAKAAQGLEGHRGSPLLKRWFVTIADIWAQQNHSKEISL